MTDDEKKIETTSTLTSDKDNPEERYNLEETFVFKTIVGSKDNDFWRWFLEGVTGGERIKLRSADPEQTKYSFRANEVYRIGSKPQFTPEQKKGYSKKQSVSIASPKEKHISGVFMHRNKKEGSCSVGVRLPLENGLYSRIFSRDFGTVGGWYRKFDTEEDANTTRKDLLSKRKLFNNIDELLKSKSNPTKHNETMARLVWEEPKLSSKKQKPEESAQICIFEEKNLRANLLAQVRARDVEHRLKKIAEKDEEHLARLEGYRVPISFYLPKKTGEEVRYYESKEAKNDIKEGLKSTDNHIKALAQFHQLSEANFDLEKSGLSESEIRDNILSILLVATRLTHASSDPFLRKVILKSDFLKSIDEKDLNNALFWERLFLLSDSKNLLKPDYFSKIDDFKKFQTVINTAYRKALLEKRYDSHLLHDRGPLLHWAARNGRTDVIEQILELKPQPNLEEKNHTGNTALMEAVKNRKIESVKKLLNAGADSKPTLIHALDNNELDILELLIEAGLDPNISIDDEKNTTLHWAAKKGNLEITEFLLNEKNVDIELRNFYNYTPLSLAVQYNKKEIVKKLLNKGADGKNLKKMQSLHFEILNKHNEIVEMLLDAQKPPEINSHDYKFNTALTYSVLTKNFSTLKKLLEKGANPNIANTEGNTPLHHAVMDGSTEAVQLLLDNKADKNAKNQHGYTPLIASIEKDNIEIAKQLLESGANLNIADTKGNTPLHHAVAHGNHEIVQMLLDNKAEINAQNQYGYTPFMEAIKNKKIEIAKQLLDRSDQKTLLIEAIKCDDSETVKNLLELGVSPNVSDEEKNTPLHHAVDRENSEILKLLLDKKADFNAKNKNGFTPFMDAIKNNKTDIAKQLLDRSNKEMLLIEAVKDNDTETVSNLIKLGVSPNISDEEKDTPLHHAIHTKNSEIVKILLDNKADINAKNENGFTPLKTAIFWSDQGIVKQLLESGANYDNINESCFKYNDLLENIKKPLEEQIKNYDYTGIFRIYNEAKLEANNTPDVKPKEILVRKITEKKPFQSIALTNGSSYKEWQDKINSMEEKNRAPEIAIIKNSLLQVLDTEFKIQFNSKINSKISEITQKTQHYREGFFNNSQKRKKCAAADQLLENLQKATSHLVNSDTPESKPEDDKADSKQQTIDIDLVRYRKDIESAINPAKSSILNDPTWSSFMKNSASLLPAAPLALLLPIMGSPIITIPSIAFFVVLSVAALSGLCALGLFAYRAKTGHYALFQSKSEKMIKEAEEWLNTILIANPTK